MCPVIFSPFTGLLSHQQKVASCAELMEASD